jgi:hypothetical protein
MRFFRLHIGDLIIINIFIGMAGTQRAIISWGVGKRNAESTMDFLHDLRSRVIGQPEISTDGFHPYRVAIRDAFGDSASHGVIVKTYSVTHLVKEAQGQYSPAAVVKVERQVVSGDPEQYVASVGLPGSRTAFQRSWIITLRQSRCTSPITTSAVSTKPSRRPQRRRWAWLTGLGAWGAYRRGAGHAAHHANPDRARAPQAVHGN